MIEKKEVEFAKEIDDAAKLLVDLVYDIRAKKDLSAIAAENLKGLMDTISNVDQVDDEVAASRRVALATIGYRIGELADAIMGGGSTEASP